MSARIPGTDQILIKAKGPDNTANEFVTERDVILIDLDGKILEAPPDLDMPNESAMHLAVYRRRPEAGSVIHAHPDWAVVLMACDAEMVPMYRAYHPPSVRLLAEGIAVYPRGVPIVNDQVGDEFAEAMGDQNLCLLLGHGITTVGKTVEEATSAGTNLYELARMNYLAYAIGRPGPVPDLNEHPSGRRSEARERPERVNAAGEPSDWRWHKQWLQARGRAIW